MSKNENDPGVLNLLKCKCTRCRQGDMFASSNPWNLKKTMKMNKVCEVCQQPLDIEVGFYYGAGYVSYALTITLSAITWVAWWILIGFSVHDNRIVYWLVFNSIFLVLLQPYLMRFSRTGWLAFFIGYDRNWRNNPPRKLERTNKLHENNW